MVQLRKEGHGERGGEFLCVDERGCVCTFPERESYKVTQMDFAAEPLSLDIFPSPCLWVGIVPVDGSVVFHSTHKP